LIDEPASPTFHLMLSLCRIAALATTTLVLGGCLATPPPAPPKEAEPAVERRPPPRHERVEIALPDLGDDASCRQARSAYVETWNMVDGRIGADLTNGQFGMILSRDRYFRHCQVPKNYEVSICAAVQNGEVRGATVATRPRAPRLERCIDDGVRNLSFPAHSRMDVTKTVFRP
jgi:hypothetical protein